MATKAPNKSPNKSKSKLTFENTADKEESRTSVTGHITVQGTTGEVLQELLNPLEHILKKYNTHPVFSSIAMVLVVIVSIGQVTDSLDKTINFTKQHFAPSRLEATLEQKSQLIDEALKSTQSLLPKNSTKKNSITSKKAKQSVSSNQKVKAKSKEIVKPKKIDSRFISEAPLSKIKSKIRSENTNQKASSPPSRFDRLQAIRKTIREEGT